MDLKSLKCIIYRSLKVHLIENLTFYKYKDYRYKKVQTLVFIIYKRIALFKLLIIKNQSKNGNSLTLKIPLNLFLKWFID